jgi:uncharacterized protein (TIRG00374 family)
MPSRKTLWVSAQAVATAIMLALLARRVDLKAVGALFVTLPLWLYLLSLAVVLIGQVMYAWRWRLLLTAAGVHVPFTVVIRQYFIGIFLNNFLPSTVGGDLAKVYLLGRDRGYRTVTASVLLDRILGVGLLALLSAVLLWLLPVTAPVIAVARLAVTGVAALSIAVVGVVAAGTGGLADRVSWMGAWPVAQAQRLQRLRFDMAAPLRSATVLSQATAVVAGYFLAVGVVYSSFIGVYTGSRPPFGMLLAVAMAASVLSNVPISLNGLGLREQLHAALLIPLGVPGEVAVAISLLFWAHLIVASVLGFLFWMRAPALPPPVAERLEA